MFSRHSPENCPEYNEKAGKAQKELLDNLEGLMKKHGCKLIGAWVVPTEHLVVAAIQISSLEAFLKLSREPPLAAMGAFNTDEYKLAVTLEEAIQMLPQAK
jgi:hypothetical protein